jgi:hypothetical protein
VGEEASGISGMITLIAQNMSGLCEPSTWLLLGMGGSEFPEESSRLATHYLSALSVSSSFPARPHWEERSHS